MQLDGLEFPISVKDINKFEKNNPEIAVNVLYTYEYGVDGVNEGIEQADDIGSATDIVTILRKSKLDDRKLLNSMIEEILYVL